MVTQVHMVLLRPCRLLILRSLDLHLLLLLPCQLLCRETDQGNGCTCCCQTVAVPLVFVPSWGPWKQHCCIVGVACDCKQDADHCFVGFWCHPQLYISCFVWATPMCVSLATKSHVVSSQVATLTLLVGGAAQCLECRLVPELAGSLVLGYA